MFDKEMGKHIFRIAGVLTLICLCVALIVAGVYRLTEQPYMDNLQKEQDAAVASLFGSDKAKTESVYDGENDSLLYAVKEGDTLLGYCAKVQSKGFGGEIEMMVAISPEKALIGVRILSMSETPGVGVKATEEGYLAKYAGLTADRELVGRQDVDFITGATISSKAVLAGINEATGLLRTYLEKTGGN